MIDWENLGRYGGCYFLNGNKPLVPVVMDGNDKVVELSEESVEPVDSVFVMSMFCASITVSTAIISKPDTRRAHGICSMCNTGKFVVGKEVI